ncbi:uncharacterized protein F5891DRAFT_1188674 [Suillus fuscotomentosus]|uniref:CxC5 like cysteine cluster associated with KDZ domain-containing protein n=1 Tax=Suillus fuscotomentosus TaxID=1912939 RepID=A0AAD4HM02_9AGAM|nr:uncharacterized protein F5891DRAFT_1188674 [Suillus fuscotomentosus]KAG1900359.1 hypothetical protein F5891DRAFT_1188674 [Suillus fuscotomentosus]
MFASLATGLKDDIILMQPATHNICKPPLFLPPSIVSFLSAACKLQVASVKMCWSVLKSSIWAGNFAVHEKMKDLFKIHRHPHGLTRHTFYPPFKMCPNSTCDCTQKGLMLSKAEQHKVVYFGRSDVVQIADHYFVDYGVVRLWKAMMHASCTSATNCTHIYNIALANAESTQFPGTKWFSKDITMDHVWNTFIICTLLEDCCERHCLLDVSQTVNQNERFIKAMSDRNRRMRTYNQPLARRHFCAKCTRIYSHGDITNKLVSVIVVDGVVTAFVTSTLHALSNVQSKAESEALHTLWGKSHFRLHKHLECSRAIHRRLANVQVGDDDDGDDDDATQVIGEEEYDVKLGKKKRLRAQFTRNYTHCEELIVVPCGMIHARETMHNAEGVGSVAEFIRHVFRDPEMCSTHNDPFFQDIGLSIDVFHFECKHSKQDTFFQENCNPAAFPELKMDDGEWYFNSSACEQTNSWFGKFNPITRGMKPVKFDFFLDEMILCRNQEMLKKLERTGKKPSVWARMSSPGV